MASKDFVVSAAASRQNADSEIMPRGGFHADNFWRRLFCNWKTLTIAALLGAACGIAAYFFVPKKWPATVIVRVGDAQPRHQFEGELLEQMSLTAAWISSKEFADAVLASMDTAAAGDAANESRDAKLFRQTLSAKGIPGSQLVRVDYLGYSHPQMQAYANAIGRQVRGAHEKIMVARLEALKGLRNKYDGELEAQERRYQSLRREYEDILREPTGSKLVMAHQIGVQLSESAMVVDLLNRAAYELDQRIEMAGQYSAVVTQAEIYVDPAFPRLGKFLPPAVLLGLLCGFIFLVIRGKTRFVLLR
ncbi:hypothetical protein DBL07_20080 [Achromobacter mucicolens]|uniref:Wzz/FepE/Etk N-terminal domain-containing protein n=1 Tax=Achromobacter mucicolens TaxID=1389922 RepID=UPI000D49EE58|nr:Wzz/FepE/Etk N-terminal domain-containing protein [Achromobacter mucicolens]PTW93450.1 hypothetical protein DBL07_20080 [Achromobacter mucicolens]